jgi:hypothetical protein
MCIGAAISGITSIAGGAMQAGAAKDAAAAQTAAAREQLALQREMYEQTREDLGPFREGGQRSFEAWQSNFGLGPAPTWEDADGNTQTYAFNTSPGYQFAVNENLDSIEGSAAARGGLYSGATMQALGERANQLANMEFYNVQDRLFGGSQLGANAAAQQANANLSNAQMGSTSLANIGNAQAAGAVGAANAWSNTLGDLGGLFGYQSNLWGGAPQAQAAAAPTAMRASSSTFTPVMRPAPTVNSSVPPYMGAAGTGPF